MTTKKVGNKSERDFVELMANKGWWCHLFAYNVNGQPCDVIALKDDRALLIDVKHCENDRFDFRRIESNQRNCFEMASKKGIKNCGFAIYFENQKSWRWLPFNDVTNLESWGYKSIRFEETDEFLWN